MNSYEAQKQERIDRYKKYAENAATRAAERANRAQQMIEIIGHHSEKRHRNYIKRIDRNFAKAVEEQDKADYWTARAELEIQHREKHSLCWNRMDNCE